ncbi:MAG: efflux RND transporter permease subunit [Chitinophagales bacterium]|nr:efflux RND transporter permease subunit [Chitinophagales bacterium]
MLRIARFIAEYPLYSFMLGLIIAAGGWLLSPFSDWAGLLGMDTLEVDALPNIGDNQQIVYCTWTGYAPEDVEAQITFPLTTALMGIPEVKTVRSNSMFGLSSIYLIFKEDADFYWCRSRVAERLSTLPEGILPEGVQPRLGPDATALGQVFWYTLEGRDSLGKATGGWTLEELRTIQDKYVKPALQSVSGVAEVASVGGLIKEYSIQLDPVLMQRLKIPLPKVVAALCKNNRDVGAKTMEINRTEYFVRGLGRIKNAEDIEAIFIEEGNAGVPIRIGDIAKVIVSSQDQLGILDKGGAEVTGGVVTIQLDANPAVVIQDLKEKVAIASEGMPKRLLLDGRSTTLSIIPFYDRSELIEESNAMLAHTLWLEVIIALIILILFLKRLDLSLLTILVLPLGVGLVFGVMYLLEVRANIVALIGIAISIGSMLDMAIIFLENLQQQEAQHPDSSYRLLVQKTLRIVGPAIMTAALTTIITFLPVFALQGEEGKLFKPLALTKTLAIAAALFISMLVLPGLTGGLMKKRKPRTPFILDRSWVKLLVLLLLAIMLIYSWHPFDHILADTLFVLFVLGSCVYGSQWVVQHYDRLLLFFFRYRTAFLAGIGALLIISACLLSRVPSAFMPAFDEGAFLVMPSTTSNSGVSECKELLQMLDMGLAAIPEVASVVGKAGRAESAIDPAPMSMFEVLVSWKPEYGNNANSEQERLWRDHIKTPDDIWNEIVAVVAQIPGLSIPPKLHPIETRLVMLQSGMNAPLGIKVQGTRLESLDTFSQRLKVSLQDIKGIQPSTVFSSQLIAKPYLEIVPDWQRAAAYGVSVDEVLQYVEMALGERSISHTLDRNQRFSISLGWAGNYQQSPETIAALPIIGRAGQSVPLGVIADINYRKGTQSIKSEDGFLVHYVLFDKEEGKSTAKVVKEAEKYLQQEIKEGHLIVPEGVSYSWEGTYQQQQRSFRRLFLLGIIAVLLLLAVLYYQFKSLALSAIVFVGVLVACSGGMLALWLWNQSWFLNFPLFGDPLREILSIGNLPITVPVWIGFLALIGLATDDGVLMATYMESNYQQLQSDKNKIIETIQKAGRQRIKAAMITTATTILALLPVLSAQDKGSELMAPMAVPLIGGMCLQVLTIFVVPLLWSIWKSKLFDHE